MTREDLGSALQRVAAGDRVALRFVYDNLSAKLFGVCLRILGDRQDAEDVLQDVFVTIWHKAAEFDPARASPVTWAATIARNRAIDRFRSRGRRSAAPLDEAAEIADDAPTADRLA
ncbi:MAG: sigma-70 family RNA polymerase sigma factor, partial [Alphaproteobacteria bacterium]|nr:sigma-70 family RNA polymerase sigma factor [Alphaproteobacteria bacterium]